MHVPRRNAGADTSQILGKRQMADGTGTANRRLPSLAYGTIAERRHHQIKNRRPEFSPDRGVTKTKS